MMTVTFCGGMDSRNEDGQESPQNVHPEILQALERFCYLLWLHRPPPGLSITLDGNWPGAAAPKQPPTGREGTSPTAPREYLEKGARHCPE